MFPYIKLFGIDLYFQGIGIILATLIFFYGIYRYSNKFGLKFAYLFSFLPFFIIVPYFFGRYFYEIIEYKHFLPLDILNLISPYNYQFSFIGVSFGLLFIIYLFLISLSYKEERKKYIDVFFYSISLSLVIIGPFLLLGDVFYGNATNSIFGISSFTQNTQIFFTGKIWPIGIFVSILGLFLYILLKIIYFIFKKHGLSIYLLPFLFLGFAGIFTFQNYPKHFVPTLKYFAFSIDIKIFYCFMMAIILPSLLYLITIKNKKG